MKPVIGSVWVRLRGEDGQEGDRRPWTAGTYSIQSPVPWRTFRWVHGQQHYSGTYWSATMGGHVVYESRLELTRLLYADFDPRVRGIFAQPFLLSAEVDGTTRRHVPDFLLTRADDVPVVVDVNPGALLGDAKVAATLAWAREVTESRGCKFEVWTEPPCDELENVRFLAGYRRTWLFDQSLLAEIRAADLVGVRLGEAFRSFPSHPVELVRSSVLHLLWTGELTSDLSTPLSSRHMLRIGPPQVTGPPRHPDASFCPAQPTTDPAPKMPQPQVAQMREGTMGDAATRIGVGSRLLYDGEIVTVEELFGSAHGIEVLVRDRHDRRLRLSLRAVLASERARVLPDGPGPQADDAGDHASVVLAQYGEDSPKLREAREWAAHINEILYGYRSGSPELPAQGEPRLPYQPAVPLMQRYRAKMDELGVSLSTLQRRIRDFHAEREAALLYQRPLVRPDLGGLGRADPRWVEMALEVMAEYGDQSKPSRAQVLVAIEARLAARYRDEKIKLPKRSTAYAYLQELDERVPTFRLSAKRNRDIASRPGNAYGRLRPTRPGEYLLMDTTRLDVFALDPLTLQWVQPELTVAMDWYTRCICGLRLTPVSTKSIDVAATLFQAFRPRAADPDWPTHAVWPEHGIPGGLVLDRDAIDGPMADAARSPGTGGPALAPETIVVDHGKIYVSDHITSVCQRMGISIQPARLRTGRDKGPLERFFRTLREDFLEYLPGYKGPDVHSRGLRPEREAVFFLNELEAIIREWVAVTYHHTLHRQLLDPRVPGRKFTPAEMFDHGIARSGYIEVPRDPDLGYEFLKTDWAPIHHYGVELSRRRYNGNGLNNWRNKTSPYIGPKAKGGWPIHLDPDDINRAYFRDPDTRHWHVLDWEHAPAINFPLSEESLELARSLAKKKHRYPNDKTAVAELLERWNLGLGLTMPERRMALRLARDHNDFALPAVSPAEAVLSLPSLNRILAVTAGGEDGEAPADSLAQEPEVIGDDDEGDDMTLPDEDGYYADALEEA